MSSIALGNSGPAVDRHLEWSSEHDRGVRFVLTQRAIRHRADDWEPKPAVGQAG